MLIPYDNGIIPIPRELRRCFDDDESEARTSPPTNTVPAPNVTADASRILTTPLAPDRPPASPGTQPAEQRGAVLHPQPIHDLRELSSHLSPGDIQLALKNYTAFNDYFYKPQRNVFDQPDAIFRNLPQKKMFKLDPLADDPMKNNPLFSVAKSLKTGAGLKSTDANVPSQLPVPKTVLADAKSNLRWGEVSCWDFMVKKGEEKSAEEELPVFRWINHGEFNVDVAIANLNDFFQKKWTRGSHWHVHIELQTRKFKPDGVTAYVFETCWSVPTRKQPVAKSTGSIFFIMDVCNAKKPEAPVIVSCHYENSPMIFDPLKIKFGAEVLTDIMERKRLLAERLIY